MIIKPWSYEEIEKLIKLYEQYGKNDDLIRSHLPTKTIEDFI